MIKVVRKPEGKERPHNAPWYTLYPRRVLSRAGQSVRYRWRTFRTSREARRSIVPKRHWRTWRLSFATLMRLYAFLGTLFVLLWVEEGIRASVIHTDTWFTSLQRTSWFRAVSTFVGPFLVAAFGLAIFLIYWYRRTRKPVVAKARKKPHELVPTAGTIIDQIVGRQELAQVIAQTLRDRRTRKPYLLVGGVGTGKTAVLVELTRMLAKQGAVPVPIELRQMAGDGELDFEKMAQRRFIGQVHHKVLSDTQGERTWRQLRLDDKAVVLADGLEEALLDDEHKDDRDNIIRRAIERAHQQQLPLVIASRPHPALQSTRAAIAELEPLSEEAALEYLLEDATEVDERRLDWIVETADVTDSPIYVQIARMLRQHDCLEHLSLREADGDGGQLETRSRDCSTLRLWLLDTWRKALVDGRLLPAEPIAGQEREATVEVISALACLGLLQDSLEVNVDDLFHTTGKEGDEDLGRRLPVTSAQLKAIWKVLRRSIQATDPRLLPEKDVRLCNTQLASLVKKGHQLGLIVGGSYGNKVRFPHSIIQAYLGFRMLSAMGSKAADVIGPALRSPGPARELLIALVFLSRHWVAASGSSATGQQSKAGSRTPGVDRLPDTLEGELCTAAKDRQDVKFFDLYAAALEIDSVGPDFRQSEIGKQLCEGWEQVRADRRTIEEAKLGLVRRYGNALRESVRRRNPEPAYGPFFTIATKEPSYPVRLAIAQEIGAGGDAALHELREHFRKVKNPVQQYAMDMRHAKGSRAERYEKWLDGLDDPPDTQTATEDTPRTAHECPETIVEDYDRDVAERWREFVLRAWLVPMLVGSVSERYRDEAEERLNLWLKHLDPAACKGTPDLPLSLENALAQGFKSAANRRKRHPDACAETRTYLVKRAEEMLTRSRSWYSQLSLLHALCLWELPDGIGRTVAAGTQKSPENAGRRGARRAPTEPSPNGGEEAGGSIDPVQSVARWLSLAGSASDAMSNGTSHRAGHDRTLLHPFVAEAGDLVALALETGHPERYIWIDEKGAIENVGSQPADPESYRKHNLWIAPSVGWSILHPRAQRLVADVLIMLNLTERDGRPDEVENHLIRANHSTLPPCLTKNRRPLHPEHTVARADADEPGRTCTPNCAFRLCPYPPRGEQSRDEIEEPFCRQQQSLLHSRSRWLPIAVSRHTPPWVGIPVKDLHRFWETMAERNRTSSGDGPPAF